MAREMIQNVLIKTKKSVLIRQIRVIRVQKRHQ